MPKVVADPSECVKPSLVPLRPDRILEITMMAAGRALEHRAARIRRAAHGYDVIERLPLELIDMLRPVGRDVDPDLPQDRNGFRSNEGGMRSGADDVEPVPEVVAEQTFRHLTSGAVAGAQDEDAALHAQQVGPQHAASAAGLRARTKALATLPLTSGAIASTSRPDSARNARASSTS